MNFAKNIDNLIKSPKCDIPDIKTDFNCITLTMSDEYWKNITEWMKLQHDYVKSLTKRQKKLLYSYNESQLSTVMNQFIRDSSLRENAAAVMIDELYIHKEFPELKNLHEKYNIQECWKLLKELNDIIFNSPSTPELLVFRGEQKSRTYLSKEIFINKGFTSTSINAAAAISYSSERYGNSQPTISQIYIPAGSKGIFIGAKEYPNFKDSRFEIVLPIETTLKLVGGLSINDNSLSANEIISNPIDTFIFNFEVIDQTNNFIIEKSVQEKIPIVKSDIKKRSVTKKSTKKRSATKKSTKKRSNIKNTTRKHSQLKKSGIKKRSNIKISRINK